MENIRNFCIIAHIDHGKSTLADRLLELTETVEKRHLQSQFLDSNPIERERGITIKLAPVRMLYTLNQPAGGQARSYALNLIDTPGHVDFSYEVNRSLAACEGAILLVDATQGVQAQTLAHFHEAQKLGLAIIPVINKVDVAGADVDGAKKQMVEILNLKVDSILFVSAKTGQGVPELLKAVIERIPPPGQQYNNTTIQRSARALVFNSNFDPHQGVVAWVRVFDGEIKTGDKILLFATSTQTQAVEVGVFTPQPKPVSRLSAGEVGYIATNLKDVSRLTVGDTVTTQLLNRAAPPVTPLPGYQPISPVVFMGIFPIDGSQINLLRDALGKLKLQDSSLEYFPESSPALGSGFRVGLLGLLHADIVQERLEREFGLELIASAPAVEYEVEKTDGEVVKISMAKDLPDASEIKEIREPILDLTIFVPESYLGDVMQLCQSHRASLINMAYTGKLVHLNYSMPFAELIRGFYDQIKSASSGFATLDYSITGFTANDLVRLDILIANERVDALSQIIPHNRAPYIARDLVEHLKEVVPRQQFEVAIQAAIGGKILARADIKTFRKDVTAKLYGGDQTRKDKLLEKQKKGKKRMKRVGKIDLPQEALLSILKVG